MSSNFVWLPKAMIQGYSEYFYSTVNDNPYVEQEARLSWCQGRALADQHNDSGEYDIKHVLPVHIATRKIVCAANRHKDLIICGARHFDPIMCRVMDEVDINQRIDWEQGFIDQFGIYLSRRDALIVAEAANQVNYERNGSKKELYSEGLY